MTHWEVLDSVRRSLIPKFAFLSASGFYLAGGTALALQLGHRTSVDFDFYTDTELRDVLPLLADIQKQLPKFATDHMADGTLIGHLDAIELSFFRYHYALLEPLVAADELRLASIPDIAAMKVAALAQRGLYRDFIDLYVISKQFGLDTVIGWARQKFPGLDVYIMLRALVYFADAEADTSMRGKTLLQPIEWGVVRRYFTTEVTRLEKGFL